MRGAERPWKIGISWDRDGRISEAADRSAVLAEPDLSAYEVGYSEPYDGALAGDTIDATATSRGLANALIELRQDLIATKKKDALAWAARIARLLRPILADGKTRAPADLAAERGVARMAGENPRSQLDEKQCSARSVAAHFPQEIME